MLEKLLREALKVVQRVDDIYDMIKREEAHRQRAEIEIIARIENLETSLRSINDYQRTLERVEYPEL